MEDINLIDKDHNKPKKSKHIKKIIYPIAIVGILFFIFLYNIIFSQDGIFKYIVENFKGLSPNSDKVLIGEQDDRLNILLLGYGGANHDGPNLTDSIHVISIKPSENKVTIFSIPRDLLVDIPDYGKRKINHAYALTEQDDPGSGGIVTSQVVSNVLGIPIHYYTTINFEGFITLIDDLGGIDVNVENSFIDYQYPDDNYEYQTVQFEKGWQTMDGDKALKFARSRHGICTTPCEHGEGSDFARARRQQLMIKALKDKLLSLKTLSNPKNLYKIFSAYSDNIKTNIELWELVKFYNLAKEVDNNNISHFILDISEESYLTERIINGSYVLIPKSENFDEIHIAIDKELNPEKFIDKKDEEEIQEEQEKILVEIQNGTTIEGYAASIANKIENKIFEITKITNADKTNIQETIIYDFTNGEKSEKLQEIKDILKNAKIAVDIPDDLIEPHIIRIHNTPIIEDTYADFVIILGYDSYHD